MSRDLESSGPKRGDAGHVLVVGAGVAGMRASIDLAEAGHWVTLVDASPAIGGILSKLDHQYPSNHCGMCRMLPEVGSVQSARFCLRKGLFHDRITILTHSTVKVVRGEPGSFEVDVVRSHRWVDTGRCAGCSAPCVAACPVEVPDEFNHGLTRRKAIYRPVPQSLPDTLVIDRDACTRCGDCKAVCPQDAIELGAPDETATIAADAVIVSVGASLHRPGDPATAHLCVSEDVVTALQFERMLGISGPRRTGLARPSDGAPVRRVAWLQCVGSRDRKHGRDVCSTVCCRFALKEATLVREIGDGAIDATIFYMDIRGHGRDFQRGRERAEDMGVRLIRSRVHSVAPAAGGGVTLRFFEEASGTMKREAFDLLVLSTGQAAAPELTSLFGDGPGVFYAGSATGPTDIGESVTGAMAAASEAEQLLSSLGRGAEDREPAGKVPRDEAGVLVIRCRCHHGGDCAAWSLPGAVVREVDSPCQQRGSLGTMPVGAGFKPARGQEKEGAASVADLLAGSKQSRVVFAACREHADRRTFTRLAAQAGYDPELVRVVDARESRVAVKMAVAALASVIDRPQSPSIYPEPRVLVVGGGLAGMHAALSLARLDVDVDVVERDEQLGGQLATHPGKTFRGRDLRDHVRQLASEVASNGRITVHLGATVVSSTGVPGRSDSIVRTPKGDVVIAHGATILATGGAQAATDSYGYGTSDRIVTQAEFERRLAEGEIDPGSLGTVVMIQCVDSREPGAHRYCSRICCTRALRNADRIREMNANARVAVLYRDMMTCGLWERDFTEARKRGVLFTTFGVDGKPRVQVKDGRPTVVVRDPVLGRPLELDADWLVLSTAVEADASNGDLGTVFGAELDEDGFFLEADAKWRPVDAIRDGVFVAGTAHGPKPARQVMAEAEAAALRVRDRLRRPIASSVHAVARVHDALCSRCQVCVEACPYHARWLDVQDNRIVVDPLGCRACGACTAACPNSATRLGAAGERQVMAALEAALEDVVMGSRGQEGSR